MPARHPEIAASDDAGTDTPEASLAEVLVDMLEEGKRRHRERDEVRWRERVAPPPPTSVPAIGCLGRLVLLLLVLFALVAAGILSLMAGLAY